MVLVQKEIKKVYLGNILVRPTPTQWFTYSYNFTTWSVADLQSQWWTIPSGVSVSSSWMTANNTWSTPSFSNVPWLNTALQTATNIHMEFTYEQSYTSDFQHWLSVSNSNSGTELLLYWDGRWVEMVIWETTYISWNKTGYVTWLYKREFDLDLSNKTVSYDIWWWQSWSFTITDTNVTNVRTWANMWLIVSINGYLKNITLTIS